MKLLSPVLALGLLLTAAACTRDGGANKEQSRIEPPTSLAPAPGGISDAPPAGHPPTTAGAGGRPVAPGEPATPHDVHTQGTERRPPAKDANRPGPGEDGGKDNVR